MSETRADFEARCARGVHVAALEEHTAECVVLGDRKAYVDTRDTSIGACFIREGFWESWITLAISGAIKPGDRFLDVGANLGWYCLVAAEAGAEVVGAIEPSNRCADLLARTFAANGIEAPVVRKAAWSKSGEALALEQDPGNLGGMSVMVKRFETQPTESVALDDLDFGQIDVVKIDVEGAEMEVWRGMRRIRERPGFRCFMEFTPCGFAGGFTGAMAAFREIQADGFTIRVINPESGSDEVSDKDLREISAAKDVWFMLDLRREAVVGLDVPRETPGAASMSKLRLLHVSDVAPTGFGRVTSNVLGRLVAAWDVAVIGISYGGDPIALPYRVYPAGTGGDPLGLGRFQSIVRKEKPDVVLINSDPWVVAHFLDKADWIADSPPIVGYMPIDSPFQLKSKVGRALSRLTTAVWYTEFGAAEARRAGFRGEAVVIPHGIDLALYGPMDRSEARHAIKLPIPDGAFLVGNVNRNQPRKRLDLTIDYFGEWRRRRPEVDSYLYLHCDAHDVGYDIAHLVEAAGLVGRVFWPSQLSMERQRVFNEALMRAVYSACDVQVTTTLGEGFGLTQMESMACGVAQIVPDYSALGEWPRGAVEYVSVSAIEAHSNYESGGIGGVVDKTKFVAALDRLYLDPKRREELGIAGLKLVERGEFRWGLVAAQFDAVLREAIERKVRPAPLYDREAVPC